MSPHKSKLLLAGWVSAILVSVGTAAAEVPATPDSYVPDSSSVVFDSDASPEELLESAREMFIADEYNLAEMLYKSVLVREPNNLSAMLELAIIYEATGQLQYAKGLLTRALIIRPNDPEIIQRHTDIVYRLSAVLASEIDSLFAAGAYEPAIPKLAILLTTQPENAELYYKKAVCHLELGHPDGALAEIDRALSIRRDERFYDVKDRARAALNHNEIVSLTSKARQSLFTHTKQGDEDALFLIQRILELDPENEWAKNQFLLLTDDHSPSNPGTVFDRLAWLWAPVAKQLKRAGEGLLLIAETFRSHLKILLAVLFALLLFASPLTHVIVRGFSPRQSLAGRLDHFTIHELLSLINTHRQTGLLILKTPSGRGKIYFNDGEVYHCTAGRLQGRPAVQSLLEASLDGSFVFKEGVTTKADTIDTPLSLILLELPERNQSVTSESILKKQKQKSKMNALLRK